MSVEPARKDLTIWRGSTFSKRWTYLESVDPRTPKDLTGYTGSLHVYDAENPEVYAAVIDGPEGAIDVEIEAEDTYTAWRGANYELKITGDGNTYTLLYGTIRSKGQAAP